MKPIGGVQKIGENGLGRPNAASEAKIEGRTLDLEFDFATLCKIWGQSDEVDDNGLGKKNERKKIKKSHQTI